MESTVTNKTICLCAIVKQEEKTIARLINSCKSIIDYYCIVDTGSTDNTIAVIKETMGDIPGEIHERSWVNFGHNRNELMELAYDKSSYLLLADADFEYVILDSFDKNTLKYDWYHLRYLGDLDFAQILLVNGNKHWFYTGVTHEYINSTNCGESPELHELSIIHHADGGSRKEKLVRDRDLLEKAIVDNPNETRNYFYLAQTYANMQEYEKAIKYYEERVRRMGWEEEVYYSLFQIGVLQYHLKNYDSATIQLAEAYSYRPTRFEALFMLGLIYREKKKYHLARIIQEEVLRMSYPKTDKLFIHLTNKRFQADFELAICYYWIGNFIQAKEHALMVKFCDGIPEDIRNQNEQNLKFIEDKLNFSMSGKNDIIYVSMFTSDTPYEKEVETLKKSLDKFNLPYEIVGLRNQGSWELNTQMKPQVIKSVMDKYNKDVVWIDADAEVLRDPEFFYSLNCDISFHYIKEWNEKMTGTMYFKNNTVTREILNKWIQLNSTNNNPDAPNFQLVISGYTDIIVADLPKEYIYIWDNQFLQCDNPVVSHHQASRRFKDKVSLKKEVPDYKSDKYNFLFTEIEKLCKDFDTCSVIGNGPFRTDLSDKIDHSFVMRCNNFKIGEQYKEIGSKIDLNISSLYHEIIPSGKVDYPILGVLPISDNLYQKYTSAKMMHLHWLNNAEKLIKNGNVVYTYGNNDAFAMLFREVTEEINAFPTVGIMAIGIARALGFKNIIISGFTFFQSEKSHYFLEEKIKPSSHHNTIAERDLISKWMSQDNRINYIVDSLTFDNLKANASSGSEYIE